MKIALVLLAYNEESVIENVARDAAQHMARNFEQGDWELLIINDDSVLIMAQSKETLKYSFVRRCSKWLKTGINNIYRWLQCHQNCWLAIKL